MLTSLRTEAATSRQTLLLCSATSTVSSIFRNTSTVIKVTATFITYRIWFILDLTNDADIRSWKSTDWRWPEMTVSPLLTADARISVTGSCVILIGPGDNEGGRHCEPEPLYLQQQEDSDWRMAAQFRWTPQILFLSLLAIVERSICSLSMAEKICFFFQNGRQWFNCCVPQKKWHILMHSTLMVCGATPSSQNYLKHFSYLWLIKCSNDS